VGPEEEVRRLRVGELAWHAQWNLGNDQNSSERCFGLES
jgi:hypothetical protein